ncbi:MAG: hypothetical protein QOH43_2327, partial [Solirubrobacteraceae bacterium]|nr:hypothetical protein [Solirubrobacteraceae bacterium]
HELGHVVDRALVPATTAATLDAGIPRGWGCDDGVTGTCATTAERFAESFWKWASGDIGIGMWLGYKVPPPGPSLDAWGAPLAALGASADRQAGRGDARTATNQGPACSTSPPPSSAASCSPVNQRL